jgi:hypothetical protein
MREQKLLMDPPLLAKILTCKMSKTVNEHGHAEITGIGSEETAASCERILEERTPVTLKAISAGAADQTIFKGIPVSIRTNWRNGLRELVIELMTGSCLLDMKERTRVFQSPAAAYEDLLRHVGEGRQDYQFLMTVGKKTPIKDLLIQYRETDWAFIKRLASHFHSVAVADDLQEGINIFFGLPYRDDNETVSLGDAVEFTVHMAIDGSILYYEVESREIYSLGKKVRFRGNVCKVYGVTSRFAEGQLIHNYDLRPDAGFATERAVNPHIANLSLAARITDVRKGEVKVAVTGVDQDRYPSSRWYPYATVYSSPDGTGWYFMPEAGDIVRLYFPGAGESSAVASGAVHTESQGRRDPERKSLKTKWGKEVVMTPTSIVISNNKGMSVALDDKSGLHLSSAGDIRIIAGNQLSLVSRGAGVLARAGGEIKMMQAGTVVNLQNNAFLAGGQVDTRV